MNSLYMLYNLPFLINYLWQWSHFMACVFLLSFGEEWDWGGWRWYELCGFQRKAGDLRNKLCWWGLQGGFYYCVFFCFFKNFPAKLNVLRTAQNEMKKILIYWKHMLKIDYISWNYLVNIHEYNMPAVLLPFISTELLLDWKWNDLKMRWRNHSFIIFYFVLRIIICLEIFNKHACLKFVFCFLFWKWLVVVRIYCSL